MHRLMTEILTEKCVIKRYHHGANVIQCTQTVQYSLQHTHAIWYSVLLLGYKPVQHVTVQYSLLHTHAICYIAYCC